VASYSRLDLPEPQFSLRRNLDYQRSTPATEDVGMILGVLTPYPVNLFLIKAGWKERMPQYKTAMKSRMRKQRSEQQRAA